MEGERLETLSETRHIFLAVALVFGGSPFLPIEEYGFLSDCETIALIALSGGVEWMCLLRMDSPSVFAAILDRDAGTFRLGLADTLVFASRRYLPGTMVLETSWGTSSGWIIVRDVLLIGLWRHEQERSRQHRRTPIDYDAEHILLRMVCCVNGEMQLTFDCEFVFDYGCWLGCWEYSTQGYHQGVCRAVGNEIVLTLTSDINMGFEGLCVLGWTLMKEGQICFVALSWGGRELSETFDDAYKWLVWTAYHWQHWLARGRIPDHLWRLYLERSALMLKGFQYEPSGAIVVALTTLLSEMPGGERNWDYRYSWIRDSTFALWGFYSFGYDWEVRDFLHFVADMASDGDLQVMYGIGGEKELTEQTLDHLSGYEGVWLVRIGNVVYRQCQHDVWGAMLDSVYLHAMCDGFDDWLWEILVRQVETALQYWRESDQGIWEVCGELQHFTSSKVMCWVAVDWGVWLACLRDEHDLAERWQHAVDEIQVDVLANALDMRGVFTQVYDIDVLDVLVLLMLFLRFLLPEDERICRIVFAIADELTEDGLVLCYWVEITDDGLGGREGAFTICSFWLVSALTEIGEFARACCLCEKLLHLASLLQLFGEEIDFETGCHLGNFLQAFMHLALINVVIYLIEVERMNGVVLLSLWLSPECVYGTVFGFVGLRRNWGCGEGLALASRFLGG